MVTTIAVILCVVVFAWVIIYDRYFVDDEYERVHDEMKDADANGYPFEDEYTIEITTQEAQPPVPTDQKAGGTNL
jgi:hypothetical protein